MSYKQLPRQHMGKYSSLEVCNVTRTQTSPPINCFNSGEGLNTGVGITYLSPRLYYGVSVVQMEVGNLILWAAIWIVYVALKGNI